MGLTKVVKFRLTLDEDSASLLPSLAEGERDAELPRLERIRRKNYQKRKQLVWYPSVFLLLRLNTQSHCRGFLNQGSSSSSVTYKEAQFAVDKMLWKAEN